MLCIFPNTKKHCERDPALFSKILFIVHYSNPALKKKFLMCFSLALSTVMPKYSYIYFHKMCMVKEGYFPICKIRKLRHKKVKIKGIKWLQIANMRFLDVISQTWYWAVIHIFKYSRPVLKYTIPFQRYGQSANKLT